MHPSAAALSPRWIEHKNMDTKYTSVPDKMKSEMDRRIEGRAAAKAQHLVLGRQIEGQTTVSTQ